LSAKSATFSVTTARPVGTCVPGDRSVVGRAQPNLGDMTRISAVLVAKNPGGRGREHLIDDQADHSGLCEQRLAFLGCQPTAFPRGLAALDETFDLLAMLGGIVDRTSNLPRMEIRLIGQCRARSSSLPTSSRNLAITSHTSGPTPSAARQGRWRSAMDDARMVERVDTFNDQPLEQLGRAGAFPSGPVGQALTCLVAAVRRKSRHTPGRVCTITGPLSRENVGWAGFEPATSASRTQRSAKLSHHPENRNGNSIRSPDGHRPANPSARGPAGLMTAFLAPPWLLGNLERSRLRVQQARGPDREAHPACGNGGRLRPG
jgi:hypothetical protein